MSWYRTGTVTVAHGSATVVGAGTSWIDGIRVGDAFRGPDGAFYEITGRTSATAIEIWPAYLGASASGAAYAIVPVEGYTRMLADRAATALGQLDDGVASAAASASTAATAATTASAAKTAAKASETAAAASQDAAATSATTAANQASAASASAASAATSKSSVETSEAGINAKWGLLKDGFVASVDGHHGVVTRADLGLTGVSSTSITTGAVVASGSIHTPGNISADGHGDLGTLTVYGDQIVGGKHNVVGAVSAATVTASGTVSGATVTANSLSVSGTATVGVAQVTGAVLAGGALTSTGTSPVLRLNGTSTSAVNVIQSQHAGDTTHQFNFASDRGFTAYTINAGVASPIFQWGPGGIVGYKRQVLTGGDVGGGQDWGQAIELRGTVGQGTVTCYLQPHHVHGVRHACNLVVSGYMYIFQDNGYAQAVGWNATSDARLKSNVKPLAYGLSDVLRLATYSYDMRGVVGRQIGVIAQEVRDVIPEVVHGVEGDIELGATLSVNYPALVPVLINAIKELAAQVQELRAAAQAGSDGST